MLGFWWGFCAGSKYGEDQRRSGHVQRGIKPEGQPGFIRTYSRGNESIPLRTNPVFQEWKLTITETAPSQSWGNFSHDRNKSPRCPLPTSPHWGSNFNLRFGVRGETNHIQTVAVGMNLSLQPAREGSSWSITANSLILPAIQMSGNMIIP